MPDMTAPVRLGANCWNQYTDWPGWLSAMQRADSLGYDSLWTWDHLYPIVGSWQGPILEAYTALAAAAALTKRATLGLMVGANTFREPSLTAKMITTIDHISAGRAVLGIGAAWFETEHTGFGLAFGDGFPERLRWLGQALPIMRGMLDGTEPTVTEGRYRTSAVRNDPAPVQSHLPILIGGSGRKVTLRLVARYADACNLGGGIAEVREAEGVLLEHCAAIGRDETTIERTVGIGTPVIRDSRDEALAVQRAMMDANGKAPLWQDQPVGTPEDVIAHLAPFVELGYRHLIAGFPSPYDEESMTRLATEVAPRLKEMIRG
ncbi:MAG: LLM class flavin-dependent oxidoreductase [Chloroflexi bacterium]|nr:LLM class flavin-dependent oxidoreductase [Chloroflexota bacterium]